MLRTAALRLEEANRTFSFDGPRLAWFLLHIAIVLYVGVGWMFASRGALYCYLLLLPLMVMQWLLNGGASIINNFENLTRTGRWSDKANNQFEGAFFSTVLKVFGLQASQAQITTLLCSLMMIFWFAALCRMILIVA